MILNLYQIEVGDGPKAQAIDSAVWRMIDHFCGGDSFLGDADEDFKELRESIAQSWSDNSDQMHPVGYIIGMNDVYVFSRHDEYPGHAPFHSSTRLTG